MHSVMLTFVWIILAGALLYTGPQSKARSRLCGFSGGMPASSNVDYQAVIEYQFPDATGRLCTGRWSSPAFTSESKTRDFSSREMPVGKTVVVKYDPKDPKVNNLELDSWIYTDDRPLRLDL